MLHPRRGNPAPGGGRCLDVSRANAAGLLVAAAFLAGMVTVAFLLRPSPPEPLPTITLADRVATYDPVRAGEPLPAGYRPLLARDAIFPVYQPTFVAASASDWSPETLVIGVEIDGDARAYPVAHLNHREIVIDEVGGMPLLVSW